MYIKPLYHFGFRSEETGDGDSGGGANNRPAAKRYVKPPASSDAGDDGDPDSGDDGSSDRDLFNLYNRVGRDGKSKRRSTLFDSIKDIGTEEEGDGEEEGSGDEGEEDNAEDNQEKPKPKEKKKVEEKKDDDATSDDDLLDLDISKIQTAKGGPISLNATKAFEKLKNGLKAKATELESLKTEVESLKTQLTEKSAVDPEIVQKYESLKQEYENEYFEKTDAFKQAYEVPIESARDAINDYFSIDPADKDTIASVKSLLKEASDAAASGKKMAFAKVLDRIADEHVEGSSAVKTMFSQDMLKWYEAVNEYTKIYKVKDAERKELIANKLKSRRQEGAGKIISSLEEGVSSFKRNKKAVIDNLPDSIKGEYLKTIDDYADSVKSSVADFQLTGTMTPEITEVLKRGVTAQAIEKELSIAWGAFGDLKNKNKVLSDENAELKSKLAKLTGEPRRDRSTVQKPASYSRPSYTPPARGKSRIMERVMANGGLDDDD